MVVRISSRNVTQQAAFSEVLPFRCYLGFIFLNLGDEIAAGRDVVAETELVIDGVPWKGLAFLLKGEDLEMAVFKFVFGNQFLRFEEGAEH